MENQDCKEIIIQLLERTARQNNCVDNHIRWCCNRGENMVERIMPRLPASVPDYTIIKVRFEGAQPKEVPLPFTAMFICVIETNADPNNVEIAFDTPNKFVKLQRAFVVRGGVKKLYFKWEVTEAYKYIVIFASMRIEIIPRDKIIVPFNTYTTTVSGTFDKIAEYRTANFDAVKIMICHEGGDLGEVEIDVQFNEIVKPFRILRMHRNECIIVALTNYNAVYVYGRSLGTSTTFTVTGQGVIGGW